MGRTDDFIAAYGEDAYVYVYGATVDGIAHPSVEVFARGSAGDSINYVYYGRYSPEGGAPVDFVFHSGNNNGDWMESFKPSILAQEEVILWDL